MISAAPNINKSDTKEDVSEDIGETVRRYTVGALPPIKPPRVDVKIDEWDLKLYGKQSKSKISLIIILVIVL